MAGAPVPEYPHIGAGFAFDATVADLATTTDVTTARWAARALELPLDGVTLTGPAWPWSPTTVLTGLLVIPALVVAGVVRRRGRRPGRAPMAAVSVRDEFRRHAPS